MSTHAKANGLCGIHVAASPHYQRVEHAPSRSTMHFVPCTIDRTVCRFVLIASAGREEVSPPTFIHLFNCLTMENKRNTN